MDKTLKNHLNSFHRWQGQERRILEELKGTLSRRTIQHNHQEAIRLEPIERLIRRRFARFQARVESLLGYKILKYKVFINTVCKVVAIHIETFEGYGPSEGSTEYIEGLLEKDEALLQDLKATGIDFVSFPGWEIENK